jgi:quinol monooxygenase YgiN
MYISITSGQATPQQAEQIDKFLSQFLPKVKKSFGVVAIYHYPQPEKNQTTTIMIWKDKESLMAYRQSDLIKEAIEFEKTNNLKSTRETYPLTISF